MRSTSTAKQVAAASRPPRGALRLLCVGFILAGLSACPASWQQLDSIAGTNGFYKARVEGLKLEHVLYERRAKDESGPMIVFLEGDGRPWTRGARVSDDPTSHEPLALFLAAATPGWVVYLARPCYHELSTAADCDPRLWTSDRYGEDVVVSLATSLVRLQSARPARPIWLVGYSGGGTLATLVAPRVPRVERVITVAANLDTEAWTTLHNYEPLEGSINPFRMPALPARIRQDHLFGARDTNVPTGTAERFSASQPNARAWRFSEFDHRCCWRKRWPEIWGELTREPMPTLRLRQPVIRPACRSGP